MKGKKTQTQETLDVNDYVNSLEKQLSDGFTGTISAVTPTTNKQYFGEGAGTYDERQGIKVDVMVDDASKSTFSNWFGLPNVRGWDKSNLYAFKKKYKSVPIVNLAVEVIIDENGFFKIRY